MNRHQHSDEDENGFAVPSLTQQCQAAKGFAPVDQTTSRTSAPTRSLVNDASGEEIREDETEPAVPVKAKATPVVAVDTVFPNDLASALKKLTKLQNTQPGRSPREQREHANRVHRLGLHVYALQNEATAPIEALADQAIWNLSKVVNAPKERAAQLAALKARINRN
jgi:hypothetical protein